MKTWFLCILVSFVVYGNIDAKDFHKILSSKMKMAFIKKANLYRPDKSADQAFRDLVEGKIPKRILFFISTIYVLIDLFTTLHIFSRFF